MDFPIIIIGIIYPLSIAVIVYLFLKTSSKQAKHSSQTILQEILPIKLQAYERLVLLISRIEIKHIVTRIPPKNNENKENYFLRLLQIVEEEFEHNITQQVYVSEKAWSTIVNTKEATISVLRAGLTQKNITDATMLKEWLFKNTVQNPIKEGEKALRILRQDIAKFSP